jgi:hypothetical protein
MATGRIGTTPVLQVRWSKAPSAGTTSLSGLDDNSVSLVYSVGYEAVYRNGVLLSRTNDYTATDGTTVTLIDATITGDIIEVFANQTIPLTDTYSQTVANSLFVNQATFDAKGDLIAGTADNTYSRLAVGTNGQVLTAASTTSTGLSWTTPASGGMTLITSGSLANATAISSITQTYTDLYLYIYGVKFDTAGKYIGVWVAGASSTIPNQRIVNNTSETDNYIRFATSQQYLSGNMSLGILFKNYAGTAGSKPVFFAGNSNDGTNNNRMTGGGATSTTSAISTINVENAVGGGNITAGSYELWGIK